MKKISIIYWSGTGNTEKMAEAVSDGARIEGVEISLLEVGKATKEDVLNADAVALGCPSMGCEVLEESEMEPFVAALEQENLSGKPVVLFGSYDWGDGQWMREWEERMKAWGVNLVVEGLIAHNTPEDNDLEKCIEAGRKLTEA